MESDRAKGEEKRRGRPLAPRLDPERIQAVRDKLARQGKTIADWAHEHGEGERLVGLVLSGGRPCTSGDSHRVAVKLGLKDGEAKSLDRGFEFAR